MSALSAAASDKDGDTIKALRARVASLEALLRGEPGFYITMPRAVVEQALECLEGNISYDFHGNPYEESDELMQTAAANLRVALEQPQVEQEPALWIRRETLEQVQRVPPNKEEPENGVAGGQRLLMNVVLSAIPHSYYGQVPLYTKLDSDHNHA